MKNKNWVIQWFCPIGYNLPVSAFGLQHHLDVFLSLPLSFLVSKFGVVPKALHF
jgi:hypothetical protein